MLCVDKLTFNCYINIGYNDNTKGFPTMTDYLSKTMPFHDTVKQEWQGNLGKVISEEEYDDYVEWCDTHGCELIKETETMPTDDGEGIVENVYYTINLKEGEEEYPKKHSREYAEWANWCNQNGCVIVRDNGMYVCQKVDEHRYIKENDDGSVTVLGYKANENFTLDDDTEVVEGWDGKTYVKGEEPAQEGVEWAKKRIAELEIKLKEEDYKIIKCFEASMTAEVMPYNVTELHEQRNLYRDEINSLQEKYDVIE